MDHADIATFTKTWKAFGEYFDFQSAAYDHDGGKVRGITGAHPTVILERSVHGS
jgi:hypothetical protein